MIQNSVTFSTPIKKLREMNSIHNNKNKKKPNKKWRDPTILEILKFLHKERVSLSDTQKAL